MTSDKVRAATVRASQEEFKNEEQKLPEPWLPGVLSALEAGFTVPERGGRGGVTSKMVPGSYPSFTHVETKFQRGKVTEPSGRTCSSFAGARGRYNV